MKKRDDIISKLQNRILELEAEHHGLVGLQVQLPPEQGDTPYRKSGSSGSGSTGSSNELPFMVGASSFDSFRIRSTDLTLSLSFHSAVTHWIPSSLPPRTPTRTPRGNRKHAAESRAHRPATASYATVPTGTSRPIRRASIGKTHHRSVHARSPVATVHRPADLPLDLRPPYRRDECRQRLPPPPPP